MEVLNLDLKKVCGYYSCALFLRKKIHLSMTILYQYKKIISDYYISFWVSGQAENFIKNNFVS